MEARNLGNEGADLECIGRQSHAQPSTPMFCGKHPSSFGDFYILWYNSVNFWCETRRKWDSLCGELRQVQVVKAHNLGSEGEDLELVERRRHEGPRQRLFDTADQHKIAFYNTYRT